MIIGSCGAGKSTLARQLHEKNGIELIHLDKEYFAPNWVEPTKEDWSKTVESLIQKPNWIIDGNYGGTMDMRLNTADKIIFLNRSRWLCLYRVIKRIIMNYGKSRPDAAEGCNERFDWNFLVYTFHFNDFKRPKIFDRLSKLPSSKEVIILKSNNDVKQFLQHDITTS